MMILIKAVFRSTPQPADFPYINLIPLQFILLLPLRVTSSIKVTVSVNTLPLIKTNETGEAHTS